MPVYRLYAYDYDFFSANMAFNLILESKQEMTLIPMMEKLEIMDTYQNKKYSRILRSCLLH